MATTGLTAEEAQAALPGQNINKVCRVYTAPTGTARVLYDLPEDAPKAEGTAEPAAPKKAKRAKKTGIEAD